MLKLKASDPIDAAEYHTFIAEMRLEYEKQAKAFNFHDSESMHRPALNIPGTREATGSIPRVIWMFWAQGEAHTSISRRDELCIEGWRQLNTPDGWEVRVLDDVTARHWALPVLELFESGLPHGALFYQVRVHSEDAAALYPFRLKNASRAWSQASFATAAEHTTATTASSKMTCVQGVRRRALCEASTTRSRNRASPRSVLAGS